MGGSNLEVEGLPGMHETMGSISSSPEKENKRNKTRKKIEQKDSCVYIVNCTLRVRVCIVF